MATRTVDLSFNGSLPLLGAVEIIRCNDPKSTCHVINRSGAAIFVRLDGDDPSPTGANDGDFVVPPGWERNFSFQDTNSPELKMCATSNLAYSVEVY